MRCLPVRLALAAALHTLPVGGSCPAVAAEVAPVDALPADTNQIKRLTLEQAWARSRRIMADASAGPREGESADIVRRDRDAREARGR